MVRDLAGGGGEKKKNSTKRGDKRKSGKKYMDGPLGMITVCEKWFSPM